MFKAQTQKLSPVLPHYTLMAKVLNELRPELRLPANLHLYSFFHAPKAPESVPDL